jgi:hypothetical protein
MPNNSIFGVFAKSPLKPLEKHMRIVTKCCDQLMPFFQASYENNWEKAAKIRKKISAFENDADDIKRKLRLELPSGLFMPVKRTDLLELISQQDKIANKAKDISGRIIGRELQVPAAIQQTFSAYLTRCVDATKKAADAINELEDLLETGFRGKEVDVIERMIEQLDGIEADTDSMQINLRKELLSIESTLNPVDVMFLYQVIEWVGDLADLAERVGSRLEIMLAR